MSSSYPRPIIHKLKEAEVLYKQILAHGTAGERSHRPLRKLLRWTSLRAACVVGFGNTAKAKPPTHTTALPPSKPNLTSSPGSSMPRRGIITRSLVRTDKDRENTGIPTTPECDDAPRPPGNIFQDTICKRRDHVPKSLSSASHRSFISQQTRMHDGYRFLRDWETRHALGKDRQ
ncbi:hypothetical protein CVT25_013022 [Psilocybe cyanescens]|uniref:Uncharacterized protein n=1 Tax=Psilocybe cyanescens TaxID=93625 RepID=A0A409XM04_PSICY|nr:hypothetical protein CVT25_013022 [Psilocybe cyanescens]